jgi:DNA invertase Pin-like site-specific DNA recombinase
LTNSDAGVAFRSATEPFDTSTPVGRMLVQMLGVFAEFEREVIIDRVIAGMERKAAKGLWTGGTTPIGFVVDKKAPQLRHRRGRSRDRPPHLRPLHQGPPRHTGHRQ